jgi:hypothetical protein
MQAIDPQIQQIYDDIATYQAIAEADYGVPAWQALPVASAPHIAFRPSCSQLEPVWQTSTTVWVWAGELIYSNPEHLPATPEVWAQLQAAGVCLAGSHAVEIPLVATAEVMPKFESQVTAAQPIAVLPEANESPVPQVIQPAVVTAAPATSARSGMAGAVLPVLVLLGLGAIAVLAYRNLQGQKPTKAREKPTPQAPQPTVDEDDFELTL